MNLFDLFARNAQQYPQNQALWVEGKYYSYAELLAEANLISQIANHTPGSQIALFASKSITAYAGVLGILQSGRTYVPLNPKFPAQRNASIVSLSQASLIVVGKECITEIEACAVYLPENVTLYFHQTNQSEIPTALSSRFECITQPNKETLVQNKLSSKYAYILFTSGSTGIPKGVPVKHSSVNEYVQYLHQRYEPNSTDRFSQTFDLTFDLSVHDLFLCWNAGACLYSIPEKTVLGPGKFIREHELTFWFSVPSVAQFMDKFRMLKPGIFPTLRVSLFCGEPLPIAVAKKWQEATGYQQTENIYGPTEATIGISHYALPDEPGEIKSRNGVVSIGKIFNTQSARIVNENGQTDTAGELWLGGTQLADGYWQNETKTAESFITDDNNNRWYKTGDLVEMDAEGDIFYVSRKDFQVKIRGYRIELEEINHAISEITHEDLVFSVAWPVNDGIAESIYAFITAHCTIDKHIIMQKLTAFLPDYMVPKDIIYIQDFPLNSNGKIDKLALTQTLSKQ